ncbi:MAG: hypothetical protein ACE5KZ_00595 [Candidatus Scalinduaceae bacterium]
MSNPYVSRFNKHFPAYVYSNIASCLKLHQGVGATILICCAVDTLANYAAASPSTSGNKKKIMTFVGNYFPESYEPEIFYKIIRCGLVHSFNMENKFIILCSKETWAQEIHLKKPNGFDHVIINPYPLFRHMKKAHKLFVNDLEINKDLRQTFVNIYKSKPLIKQHIRVPKALKQINKT